MDKHSRTQSLNALPDSLRFASCRFKRFRKSKPSGRGQLMVAADSGFGFPHKGSNKGQIHKAIRREGRKFVARELVEFAA